MDVRDINKKVLTRRKDKFENEGGVLWGIDNYNPDLVVVTFLNSTRLKSIYNRCDVKIIDTGE